VPAPLIYWYRWYWAPAGALRSRGGSRPRSAAVRSAIVALFYGPSMTDLKGPHDERIVPGWRGRRTPVPHCCRRTASRSSPWTGQPPPRSRGATGWPEAEPSRKTTLSASDQT
jgi:hypothetical protein